MAEDDDEGGTSADDIEASIAEYFYERQVSGHRCGYCKSEDSFVTNGMWGHRLAGQDYQDLVNRGWRRSGKYLYKPIMNRTCCPPYAIRCEALRFRPSRSQRRVANRMRAFLVEGREPGRGGGSKAEGEGERQGKKSSKDDREEKKESCSKNQEERQGQKASESGGKVSKESVGNTDQQHVDPAAAVSGAKPTMEVPREGKMETESVSRKKKTAPRPGVGADPSKPRCRKAKEVRLEQRKKKRLAGKEAATGETTEKKCEHTNTTVGESKETVEKEGGPPVHKEDSAAEMDTSSVSKNKAEDAQSEDDPKPKKVSEPATPHMTVEELLKLPTDQKMAHKLEVKVVDCYPLTQKFLSTFIESFLLYKKYQMAIHGDKEEELSERSFRRFLCDTPLISLDGPVGWKHKYGSFHLQYYLDGKMIMVAVVDILPTYLSSVYVYYDPHYSWLDLGVYSALREIELVRTLNRTKSEFQYYCMGYYIHNNPKMSYKGRYPPSYLLCPETYRYVPLEVALPKLDRNKYSRLDDEEFTPERVVSFLGGVLILFEKQVIPYMLFRSYYGHKKDRIVVEYASLVGKEVTQRMFLYLMLDGTQQDDDSDD